VCALGPCLLLTLQTDSHLEVPTMTRSLLSWVRGHSGRKPARRPAARQRSFVPRVLLLEDRTLLNTYTVTNLADSGPGSLRPAAPARCGRRCSTPMPTRAPI